MLYSLRLMFGILYQNLNGMKLQGSNSTKNKTMGTELKF